MESAFYGYFYLKTENLSITWDTLMIESFIEQNGGYIRETCGTAYRHTCLFCFIGLMKVKSIDSWNSKDYNKDETNYISILTSKHPEKEIIDFLNDLSKLLNTELVDETDEDC